VSATDASQPFAGWDDGEDTGGAELVFTTIEYLDRANPPLPLATTAVW
jgi:hypothetical protein